MLQTEPHDGVDFPVLRVDPRVEVGVCAVVHAECDLVVMIDFRSTVLSVPLSFCRTEAVDRRILIWLGIRNW